MTQNVTIQEGIADPNNDIGIWFVYLEDQWTVEFTSTDHGDWTQRELKDWLVDRLDAPMTVAEATEDDRVHVQNKDDEFSETEIGGFASDEVARATYDPDTVEWTVEMLID
jgi:hypothetical protein